MYLRGIGILSGSGVKVVGKLGMVFLFMELRYKHVIICSAVLGLP